MKRKWKRWLIFASIAITSAIGARMLSMRSSIEQLHLKSVDAQFIFRPPLPTRDIVLVVIDQRSLDTYKELLSFWHPYYAEAIRGAAKGGAKVIALDLAFAVPVVQYAPDNDRVLAEAVATSEIPVVCGYVPGANARQQDWPVPVNVLAAALGLAAFANLTADPDDFIRNQVLIEAPDPKGPSDVPLARSLATRTAEKFLGQDAILKDNRLSLAGHSVPVTSQRTITINFAGGPGTFPRVSLADFIAASKAGQTDKLAAWVRGKAVLLGPDGIEDRYPTPFYTLLSGPKWTTAGVEIHANTLRTLLERDYLLHAPPWARMLALLLVTGAGILIVGAGHARHAALWVVLEIAVVLAGTQAVFRSGWILYASELLIGLILCLIASVVYRVLTAEKRGNLFRQAVSVFVGKKVATSLDESDVIAHTGTRQNLTILFTDIRGFTAFCESKDPAVIVELLNRYLATMVSIIVRHQGHVNKFIGDGILAIFSDEECVEPGDHALRAVRCATEMVCAPSEFKTGSGIHTGPAVVGNIGSPDKMEYTVLGDTVNLASRLESLNKEHHTKLLMSGDTQAMLANQIEVVCLGSVPVRGKAEPIPLFTVAALVAPEEQHVAASVVK